jgi:hypothetical protein
MVQKIRPTDILFPQSPFSNFYFTIVQYNCFASSLCSGRLSARVKFLPTSGIGIPHFKTSSAAWWVRYKELFLAVLVSQTRFGICEPKTGIMKSSFLLKHFVIIVTTLFFNYSFPQAPEVNLKTVDIIGASGLLEKDPRTDSAEIFEKIRSTIREVLKDEKEPVKVFVQLTIYADKKREFNVAVNAEMSHYVFSLFDEIDKIKIESINDFDFRYDIRFYVNGG